MKITIAVVSALLGLIFVIFGGPYNWVAFIFFGICAYLGVFNDMKEDYKRLFKK